MAAFWLVQRRRRKLLTGQLCLMDPTQWSFRRVFCPRAKPPPPAQAPAPALHPSKARSGELRPLPLTKSPTLLPPVLPGLLPLCLFIILFLRHTRRRRTPTLRLHAQPPGPRPGDRLWTPSSLPSSSSSSATTPEEEPEPWAVKTPRWAFSTSNHKARLSTRCSSWRTRASRPRALNPALSQASSDPVTAQCLHRGTSWGSRSERGWT